MTQKRKRIIQIKQETNITEGFVLAILLSLLYVATSTNVIIGLYAIFSFVTMVLLLWRKGEPPVLVFAGTFQWAQASTKIMQANNMGLTIPEYQKAVVTAISTAKGPPEGTEMAVWLSLTGIMVLALGARVMFYNMPAIKMERIQFEVSFLSTNRLFRIYFLFFIIMYVLNEFVFAIPQLSQIFVTLINLKWLIFFILVITIIIKNENPIYAWLIIGLETVLGFTGFFSEFKEVFFFFGITLLTIRQDFKLRTIIPLSLAIAFLMFLSIFWTSIKGGYREFVSQGTQSQAVLVSVQDQIDYVVDKIYLLTPEHYQLAFDALLDRISYVDFFGATLELVPTYVAHEEGAIYGGAIGHIFMPRLLFPDKPILPSDSEHTMKYTGIILASGTSGASFSIGYMADAYIDFGVPLMFVPVFLLGMLWGWMYRMFVLRSNIKLIGMGLAMIVLIHTFKLETAIIKLFGGVMIKFIILFVMMLFMERDMFKFINLK